MAASAAPVRRTVSYKTCAFTGHRPQKMAFGFDEEDSRCAAFKQRLTRTLEDLIGQGYARFLSGGAMGFDTFAAEAVLDLREKYPWISLEMVCPYEGQAEKWGEAYRRRHDRLVALADRVVTMTRDYEKGSIFRRNRYLVNHCDLLLAAFDGQPGGTAMTVDYARSRSVDVRIFA
ncbi:MAG: DUF1273 family protein [Clostridia bacterium]|nr:DUF1273 family protein [Clostridia bacterium]